MLGPTARFGITHPALDRLDAPDIPLHLKNIVDQLEALAPLYGQGNTASRPTSTPGSPGKTGRFYMDTQVSPHILYYDHGTGWDTVGYLAPGSVTATELADLAVTTAKINNLAVTTGKLADLGVTTAKIADLAVTFGKLEAALKPSQGAGTSAEALRALGTAAGTAAAGIHAAQHMPGGADPIVSIPGDPVLTLPGAPVDKQQALLVDSVTVPTWAWLFQYESGITDAYKWICIGGSAAVSEDDASFGLNNAGANKCGIVVPRAGIYDQHCSLGLSIAFVNQDVRLYAYDGTTAKQVMYDSDAGADHGGSGGGTRRWTVAAGTTLYARAGATSGPGNATFQFVMNSVRPLRVA